MATKVTLIDKWFDEGLKQDATHMIIVCDKFNWEDYPVYVSKDEDVKVIEKRYDPNKLQLIMEVYDLKLSKKKQLEECRAFNY